MTLTAKNIFLIDGAGAIASASLLIVISTRFQNAVGMPTDMLHVLAATACLFAVYSFSCFLFLKHRWKLFLKIIAAANSMYCLITIGAIGYYFDQMTPLGLLYFGVEITVIVFLVMIEVGVVRRETDSEGPSDFADGRR